MHFFARCLWFSHCYRRNYADWDETTGALSTMPTAIYGKRRSDICCTQVVYQSPMHLCLCFAADTKKHLQKRSARHCSLGKRRRSSSPLRPLLLLQLLMLAVMIDLLYRVKPISQLRFDYDATTIRGCHDAFDYDESDRNYDLRSIRLRYDYDTTIRRKIDTLIFCSRRIASNGSRRARYVAVASQSNRNFDHFRRSRMHSGIVV